MPVNAARRKDRDHSDAYRLVTEKEFEMTKKQDIPDDTYARESFTFRRMTKGQLWSITLAVILLAVIAIAYSWS